MSPWELRSVICLVVIPLTAPWQSTIVYIEVAAPEYPACYSNRPVTSQPPPDQPDWSREARRALWDPSRRLLQSIRQYQRWSKRRGPAATLVRRVWGLQHRFWSIVTASEIPLECQIEGGLQIPHPNGIVIHPDTRIGPNCLIFQQVTLGTRGDSGAPTIGGRVDIGAGARVLGDISLGDYCKVGANSVVISTFPASSVLVGVPARRVGPATARPKRIPSVRRLVAGSN